MGEHTTPTPWRYRPRDFDDWGFIRGPSDELVAVAKDGAYLDPAALDEHRKNKTDPAGPNAAIIVKAVNAHEGLVRTLEEIGNGGNEVFLRWLARAALDLVAKGERG